MPSTAMELTETEQSCVAAALSFEVAVITTLPEKLRSTLTVPVESTETSEGLAETQVMVLSVASSGPMVAVSE